MSANASDIPATDGQSEPARSGRIAISGRMVIAILGALTTLGLLLRLPSFSSSLFGDELSTYYIVTGNGLGHVVDQLIGAHAGDLNPPLYFGLAWLAERLGDSSELLRLPSLLAGLAAIPLTYLLGERAVDRRAGLVAAALMSLSPFLIYYSTEARSFGTAMLFTLLSTLALLRAIDTRRTAWWFAYAALSCASVYTNYTTIFLLAGQFGWAIWTQPDLRPQLVIANAGAVLAYLPWVPSVIDAANSPGADVPALLGPFTLDSFRTELGRWSIGHPFERLSELPGHVGVVLIAAGVTVALLGLGGRALAARRAEARWRPSAGVGLVVVLAASAPVGEALYSWLAHSVWDQQQLIASTPGLAVLTATLLTRAGPRLAFLTSFLVLAGFGIGAAKMLDADAQRPDLNGPVAFVDRRAAVGDPILELSLPTPGPLTALDVALADAGIPWSRYPALRAGSRPVARCSMRLPTRSS